MNSNSTSTFVRELGYIETLCHLYNEELFGTTKVSTMVEVTGPLDFELVKKAAELEYLQQPLLQTNIKRGEKNFFLDKTTPFSAIPITKKTIGRAEDVNQIFTDELDKPLVSTKYLWRLVYINIANDKNRHFIIVTTNHAIVDGISLAYFMEQFLEFCKAIKKGVKLNIKPYALHDTMERLIPGSQKFDDYLKYWKEYYARKRALGNSAASDEVFQDSAFGDIKKSTEESAGKLVKTIPFAKNVSLAKRKHQTITKFINSDKLEALKKRAREEKTTINAALGATLLKAGQKQIPQLGAWNIYTAVDFRNHCKPPVLNPEIGCYTGTPKITFEFDINKIDFWQLARFYKQQLNNEIDLQPKSLINDSKLETIQKFSSSPKLRFANQFNLNLLLTNLGVVDYKKDLAPFAIKNLRFASNEVSSEFILTLAVNTIANRANLDFFYLKPLVDEKWARKFVSDFMGILGKQG